MEAIHEVRLQVLALVSVPPRDRDADGIALACLAPVTVDLVHGGARRDMRLQALEGDISDIVSMGNAGR